MKKIIFGYLEIDMGNGDVLEINMTILWLVVIIFLEVLWKVKTW
jgi:hypothetical protein